MIQIILHTDKPFFASVKDDEAEYRSRVVATLTKLALDVKDNGLKKYWVVDNEAAGDGVIARLQITED